jgi:hypothetical protein
VLHRRKRRGRSWPLGKLSQAARQDAEASAHFQAALAVEGASAKAKEAASEGLRSISEKSKQ